MRFIVVILLISFFLFVSSSFFLFMILSSQIISAAINEDLCLTEDRRTRSLSMGFLSLADADNESKISFGTDDDPEARI